MTTEAIRQAHQARKAAQAAALASLQAAADQDHLVDLDALQDALEALEQEAGQ